MQETSFNDLFPYIWDIARNRGMNKSTFMSKCGFPKQRFPHWMSGKQNLTARNFIKLLEVLRLDCIHFEEITKRKLTPEQREEVSIKKWEKKNRDLLKILMDNEELTKKFRNDAGLI